MYALRMTPSRLALHRRGNTDDRGVVSELLCPPCTEAAKRMTDYDVAVPGMVSNNLAVFLAAEASREHAAPRKRYVNGFEALLFHEAQDYIRAAIAVGPYAVDPDDAH